MPKSFLLSKLSVLALTAVVLHSLAVAAWSKKRGSEEDQESNTAKRARPLTSMLEIWLTPRCLVNKKISQLAPNHHIRVVSGQNWDAAKAPVGIFFTYAMDAVLSGGNDSCRHLTAESMDELGSENLFTKYTKSTHMGSITTVTPIWGWYTSNFHISFADWDKT